jgi:adenosylcobinamide kinase/adenosylcobinamide-phosphate guanylyltransferase
VAGASSLIFISGGVRSGKSSFAEKKAEQIANETGGQLHYLATGVPSDGEMQERINKHKRDREAGVYHWKTVEKPTQIEKLAGTFNNRDIILLDCITTLLNNELFSSEHEWDQPFLEKIRDGIVTGISEIKNRVGVMIVVSNEVLLEPLHGNHLVFTYGRLLGQIHQKLVKEADLAFLIESGIPIIMKGVIR